MNYRDRGDWYGTFESNPNNGRWFRDDYVEILLKEKDKQIEELKDRIKLWDMKDKQITIFEKKYDGESLYDLSRDVSECLDECFNPIIKTIPSDECGIQEGTFHLILVWTPEE